MLVFSSAPEELAQCKILLNTRGLLAIFRSMLTLSMAPVSFTSLQRQLVCPLLVVRDLDFDLCFICSSSVGQHPWDILIRSWTAHRFVGAAPLKGRLPKDFRKLTLDVGFRSSKHVRSEWSFD